ncbi:hypothetical protein QJQ45_006544 [Haematococcus lacustris]|nr:hypothetical protein QJQ45_006544 [Haematococcus lacustris]
MQHVAGAGAGAGAGRLTTQVTYVLAIIPLPNGTAEAHAQIIMEELLLHGLDSACIASITADSAAVNMSEYGGQASSAVQLLQENSLLLRMSVVAVIGESFLVPELMWANKDDAFELYRHTQDVLARLGTWDTLPLLAVESLLQMLKHGGGRYMELPTLLQLMSLRTCKEAIKTVDVNDLQQRIGKLRAEVRRKEDVAAQQSAKAECQITEAAHKVGRVVVNVGDHACRERLAAAHALAFGGRDFGHTTVEEAMKMIGKQLQTYLQFHKQKDTSWRLPKLQSHVCTHIRGKLAAAAPPQQQLTPAGTTPELVVPTGAPPQQQQQLAAASTSRKRKARAAKKSRVAKRVAPRRPPQAPRSSQAATQPAASEPGPSTPQPAKRSKRTKAEPGAAEPTKGKGKGKAAKAKPAPQPGRWMQRIGESRWRPLELCYWPDQGALPAKGKEYPGLGYKRLRDKPPQAQQMQPAVAQ